MVKKFRTKKIQLAKAIRALPGPKFERGGKNYEENSCRSTGGAQPSGRCNIMITQQR
jgi:hypothetical protein